jgi:hypothetical protein
MIRSSRTPKAIRLVALALFLTGVLTGCGLLGRRADAPSAGAIAPTTGSVVVRSVRPLFEFGHRCAREDRLWLGEDHGFPDGRTVAPTTSSPDERCAGADPGTPSRLVVVAGARKS